MQRTRLSQEKPTATNARRLCYQGVKEREYNKQDARPVTEDRSPQGHYRGRGKFQFYRRQPASLCDPNELPLNEDAGRSKRVTVPGYQARRSSAAATGSTQLLRRGR